MSHLRASLSPVKVETILRTVAASIVMPKFADLSAAEIFEKSPGDLVTVADQGAEKAIAKQLRQLHAAPVLGEEATATDPSLMDLVHRSGPVWVVDPIDGTGNFARRRPQFALMVAFVVAGEVESAWIYQPVPDVMFTAKRGQGAFRNGTPLQRPAAATQIGQLRGSSSFGPQSPLFAHLAARKDAFASMDRGASSAGWDYPHLATGVTDFALYRRSLPWDHAPGALLVREAGGVVRRFDGTDFSLRDGKSGILAASDQACWELVAATLAFPPPTATVTNRQP